MVVKKITAMNWKNETQNLKISIKTLDVLMLYLHVQWIY